MTDILSLTGKDLDRELDRIIKDAPQRRKFWTEKEDLVLKRLWKAGMRADKIAETIGRSKMAVELRYYSIRG